MSLPRGRSERERDADEEEDRVEASGAVPCMRLAWNCLGIFGTLAQVGVPKPGTEAPIEVRPLPPAQPQLQLTVPRADHGRRCDAEEVDRRQCVPFSHCPMRLESRR